MKEEFKAYISIHLAVILFGFTAILGAVITLPAMILVWWRVMIAGIGLTFFSKRLPLFKDDIQITTPAIHRNR